MSHRTPTHEARAPEPGCPLGSHTAFGVAPVVDAIAGALVKGRTRQQHLVRPLDLSLYSTLLGLLRALLDAREREKLEVVVLP
jgi:hypothetical protein